MLLVRATASTGGTHCVTFLYGLLIFSRRKRAVAAEIGMLSRMMMVSNVPTLVRETCVVCADEQERGGGGDEDVGFGLFSAQRLKMPSKVGVPLNVMRQVIFPPVRSKVRPVPET